MPYAVKEIFHSLQGEGGYAGHSAIFVRFAGCNLWNGLEEGRAKGKGSCALWCDTDFVGTDGQNGGRFPSDRELVARIAEVAVTGLNGRPVIFTGGEPLLQLDQNLVDALHAVGCRVHVETNGTVMPKAVYLDWVTVSPKLGLPLVVPPMGIHEIKLVAANNHLDGGLMEWVNKVVAANPDVQLYIQPVDGDGMGPAPKEVADFCVKHPQWRLSLQMHKIVGLD